MRLSILFIAGLLSHGFIEEIPLEDSASNLTFLYLQVVSLKCKGLGSERESSWGSWSLSGGERWCPGQADDPHLPTHTPGAPIGVSVPNERRSSVPISHLLWAQLWPLGTPT